LLSGSKSLRSWSVVSLSTNLFVELTTTHTPS
jgi:hypothetical protein